MVPHTVQKRAPAGSGAPHPLHGPADLSTGAAASAESGGRGGGGGSISADAGPPDGTALDAACAEAARAEVAAPVPATPVVAGPTGAAGPTGFPSGPNVGGGGAINDWPQLGQTVQAGSSTIFWQF